MSVRAPALPPALLLVLSSGCNPAVSVQPSTGPTVETGACTRQGPRPTRERVRLWKENKRRWRGLGRRSNTPEFQMFSSAAPEGVLLERRDSGKLRF